MFIALATSQPTFLSGPLFSQFPHILQGESSSWHVQEACATEYIKTVISYLHVLRTTWSIIMKTDTQISLHPNKRCTTVLALFPGLPRFRSSFFVHYNTQRWKSALPPLCIILNANQRTKSKPGNEARLSSTQLVM